MKATGIVRNIDRLGRVVIPKEVRRTMRINEGDPLEIFTDDGRIIFQKYSVIGNIGGIANDVLEAMYRSHKMPVIACDKEKVVAARGIPKNEIVNRRLTGDMEEMMERRSVYAHDADNGSPCFPVEGIERHAVAMAPVIASGDVVGAIIFLSPDNIQAATAYQTEVDLARAFALYLGELLGD